MLVCSCHCPCIVIFVPPNSTAHGNPSLRVRSIFYFGHLQVITNHATEPFVLHAWLLRRIQLKYGKLIDSHIAGKKTQRTTSICCDLSTTKEIWADRVNSNNLALAVRDWAHCAQDRQSWKVLLKQALTKYWL
jgi:hypothetical protein